jgi:hypothetical protein
VDRLQFGRRVDAELVGQPGPQPLVGAEGVGLPTLEGQGAQQLGAEPLRQRMGGHQLLELGHQPVGGAGCQVGLDPVLQGLEAQAVQPGHSRGGEAGAARIGQGRPPPQGQGLPQQRPGPARVAAQLLPAGQGQGLEADGVDRLGGHGQPVAGGEGLDHAGSRRRRRETSAWRALAAPAGGRSSQTASTSWPEVTTRPGSSARRSNSRRSRAPATSTRWPEPARASSGPRTPIRSSPDTPPFCPAAAPWPTGAQPPAEVARYRSGRQPISAPWWASWSIIIHRIGQAGHRSA